MIVENWTFDQRPVCQRLSLTGVRVILTKFYYLFMPTQKNRFSREKGAEKKHCRPRKCYFQHGCLRPKDEATVFPPRQEKVLFKQPHFGGRFLTACQPFKEGIFSSLQDKWKRLFSSQHSAKYMQNLLEFKPTNAWRPRIRSSLTLQGYPTKVSS